MYVQGRSPMFDQLVQKIPWRREWQATPVFLLAKFSWQRRQADYNPWGHKDLEMTEQLTWKEILLFLVSLVRLSLLTTSLLNWFCYVTLILNSCVSISICLWVFLNSFLTHWFCNMVLAFVFFAVIFFSCSWFIVSYCCSQKRFIIWFHYSLIYVSCFVGWYIIFLENVSCAIGKTVYSAAFGWS